MTERKEFKILSILSTNKWINMVYIPKYERPITVSKIKPKLYLKPKRYIGTANKIAIKSGFIITFMFGATLNFLANIYLDKKVIKIEVEVAIAAPNIP